MGRPLRFLPPECPLVEVTCRTLQERFLLRPSVALNMITVGVLARAARHYEMRVCAFVFLSNHYHLLLRPRDARHLSEFMNYFNGNLAREAGRIHHWRQKIWARPYRAIPISSEPEAQVERLEYLLAQGCKEGLVSEPHEWPGAHCVRALLSEELVAGVWYDRTSAYRASRWGTSVDPDDYTEEEAFELVPIPAWEGLRLEERQALIEKILSQIIEETAERIRRTGRRPLGRRAILRQHPHSRPLRAERSPAPRFHTASFEFRKMLEAMYRSFLALRAEALEELRAGRLPIRFPKHGIPPPLIAPLAHD